MSLVRLLGFHTLGCGCVLGKYRDLTSGRELVYVEEKGTTCTTSNHRRNHTVTPDHPRSSVSAFAAKAS